MQEEQEMRDIKAQIIKDGLQLDSSEEAKIRHLYRKLLRTEQQLSSTLDNMEEQRRQTREEMTAVETYVTHIRSLSDEREQLVRDLEAENETLKAQLQQAKATGHQEAAQSWLAARDLLQSSGLEQLADEPRQAVEQLLEERRQLLTNLAESEVQVSGCRVDPGGQTDRQTDTHAHTHTHTHTLYTKEWSWHTHTLHEGIMWSWHAYVVMHVERAVCMCILCKDSEE